MKVKFPTKCQDISKAKYFVTAQTEVTKWVASLVDPLSSGEKRPGDITPVGCDLIQVKFECQDMRSMCSQWVLICHRTYGQPDDRDWRDELRWIKVVKVHLSQLLEKHLKFSKGGILSSGSNLGCQFATKLEPYYLHLSTNIYKWLQACIGCLAHFEAQILLTFESTFDSCIWYVFDVVLNVIWREVPCIGSLSCGFFWVQVNAFGASSSDHVQSRPVSWLTCFFSGDAFLGVFCVPKQSSI